MILLADRLTEAAERKQAVAPLTLNRSSKLNGKAGEYDGIPILTLAQTQELLRAQYAEAAQAGIRVKLPNLQYPNIVPIRADAFDLDLSENRQRNPEKRRKKLVAQFGENGERFNFDDFEVVTALLRPDGTLFPGAGMGRVWSVVNLLKRPDLLIPTLIKGIVGDQPEKRTFVHSMTNTAPISSAELFMTYGNMTGADYELHRAYVAELNRLGLTTVPGGPNAVTYTATIFCCRLGTLATAHDKARKWWFARTNSKGVYKTKVEGCAMAAVGAFAYLYGDTVDWTRAERKFGNKIFDDIKRIAVETYTDAKSHQGRDDAPAVLKWMVRQYNTGTKPSRFKLLDIAEAVKIRDDFERPDAKKGVVGAKFFNEMHDAWRMFDTVDDSED
jgi:hypothetical protein